MPLAQLIYDEVTGTRYVNGLKGAEAMNTHTGEPANVRSANKLLTETVMRGMTSFARIFSFRELAHMGFRFCKSSQR